jgi:four helix bundle protein
LHQTTLGFPKIEQFELASQLRRSSKSIVANLVEGMGRQSHPAEVQRFMRIAIGSNDESQIWLDFAKDLGYMSEDQHQQYSIRLAEVGRMLRGVMNRYQRVSNQQEAQKKRA